MKKSFAFVGTHILAILGLAYFGLWYFNRGAWNNFNTTLTEFLTQTYLGLQTAFEFAIKIKENFVKLFSK